MIYCIYCTFSITITNLYIIDTTARSDFITAKKCCGRFCQKMSCFSGPMWTMLHFRSYKAQLLTPDFKAKGFWPVYFYGWGTSTVTRVRMFIFNLVPHIISSPSSTPAHLASAQIQQCNGTFWQEKERDYTKWLEDFLLPLSHEADCGILLT